MDVSGFGSIIISVMELFGKIINFILKYAIEITIIGGSIYFVYWMFNSGTIDKIAKRIELLREEKKKLTT